MSILYKNSNGDITSLIPEINNIDDSTVAADTTYSSEKIEGTYPITTTSTASPISTANGKPRTITIYGKSEVVDGEIKSAGDSGSIEVQTCEKNLFDPTKLVTENITYTDGTLSGTASNFNAEYISGIPILFDKTRQITFSVKAYTNGASTEGNGLRINFDYTDNTRNSLIISNNTTEPQFFTLTSNPAKQMQNITISYGTYGSNIWYLSEIQLEYGSSATAYEPYNGTMAVFETGTPLRDIPDSNVRDVMTWGGSAGEVTKKCGAVDLGMLEWSLGGSLWYTTDLQTEIKPVTTNDDIANIKCAEYETSSRTEILGLNMRICVTTTGVIGITNNSYTDPTTFKAALQGVKLIYELATPTTEPLTQTENDSLAGLKTYAPQTTVTINSNPDYSIEAYANTPNGQAVQSLESDIKLRIDEVKNEKNHFCYSYKIDLSDSNPATCVKPHFDTRYGCDNFSYTSAKMNYATGVFDYGSWEGFIRRIARPCMLKYDGTVDYYLDPDDYSKKITGEASDVADVNYQGNAMVELEKLYFKRYIHNGIQYCFISDRKLDKSFHCYAHHDKYGKEIDYIYRACYDGMYDGTRLRSISGIDYHNLNALTAGYIMSNATRQEEMNFAKANNVSTEQGEGWNILHKSEWDYINDILVLISMSTDTQGTFGRGRDSGYVSTTNTGIISTGTMDTKGLFWGKNDSSAGVKVLGIENHWANIFKSCAGWINDHGTQKVKYTYGTEDGSTEEGFNINASGYISISGATPTKGDESTSGGGYITAWQYGDYGILPYETISGASNKYLCDYIWFNNTAACFALVGGYSPHGLGCGAFSSNLGNGAGYRRWTVGAALSYKPLSAA